MLSFIFKSLIFLSATLKNVDFGRMAEILVQRAGSPDEFTRLTSITWVRLNVPSVFGNYLSFNFVFFINWSFWNRLTKRLLLVMNWLFCQFFVDDWIFMLDLLNYADKWICKTCWRPTCSLLCWYLRCHITLDIRQRGQDKSGITCCFVCYQLLHFGLDTSSFLCPYVLRLQVTPIKSFVQFMLLWQRALTSEICSPFQWGAFLAT